MSTLAKKNIEQIVTRAEGRAIIFERADGASPNWYYEIKFKGEKEIVKSCKTASKADAISYTNDLFYEMLNRVKQDIAPATPHFKKFANAWLKDEIKRIKQEKLHSNAEADKSWHVRLMCEYFGTRQIDTIKDTDLKDFKDWLFDYHLNNHDQKIGDVYYKFVSRKTPNGRMKKYKQPIRPLKASSIRHIVWTFDRIMKSAIKADYITEGKRPTITITVDDEPRISFTDTHDKQMLSEDNVNFYTKFAKNGRKLTERTIYARKAFIYYMFILRYTGLRITEARWLDWGHYTVKRQEGKMPIVKLQVTHSKVKSASRRRITVDPDMHVYVQALFELQTAWLGRQPTANDPMFINSDKKRVDNYQYNFDKYMEFLNIVTTEDMPYTLYCFRHTFATTSLENGAEPYRLAKHMGTSVEMLRKHYDHSVSENEGHMVHGITDEVYVQREADRRNALEAATITKDIVKSVKQGINPFFEEEESEEEFIKVIT